MAKFKMGPRIAILGGTGAQGSGLALRWARAGYAVIVGSRSEERAMAAAAALAKEAPDARIEGMANPAAAVAADIVVMTVPYENHTPTLESVRDAVQGKIFVDVTVPLVPPRVSQVQLPPEGSAAKVAQKLLGEGVRVTSAFHNVAAVHLRDISHDPDCDVLVFGDNRAACEEIVALAAAAGMRGWQGGPIDNSMVAEGLASVLLHINRNYKIAGAGIHITGTPRSWETARRRET